jgi:hypothetical protein
MALWSTQPLTEMSTRFPGGEGWLARKADNLTAICEPLGKIMCESRRLTTIWASTASLRDNYFYYLLCEAIGTAVTPGLLCQPRVIVKMIVEKQMECRLAGET